MILAERHDTMMNPHIEGLLSRTRSKFRLVTLASMRARQINAYFGHLGDGLGTTVPPQVTSLARKPLSIAFEEIAADKIVGMTADGPLNEPPHGDRGHGEAGGYLDEPSGTGARAAAGNGPGDAPPADGGA
jgi:DNA-directed RNA polymerase subunit omega